MEGNLLDDMNFQSVSTHVSRYHVICQEPRYDSMTGEYITELDLSEDGLSFVFGHGDSFGLYGGIYFWNNGLMNRYLTNEMPYPKFPIPVREYTSGVTEKVNSEMKDAWYKDFTGKYAVYADENYLVTKPVKQKIFIPLYDDSLYLYNIKCWVEENNIVNYQYNDNPSLQKEIEYNIKEDYITN